MLNRSFAAFMVFLLVFAMVPTAFAGDSGSSAEQGVAANAGSEKTDQGNEGDLANVPNQNLEATDENQENEGNRTPEDDVQKADEPEMTVEWVVGYTVTNGEEFYSVDVRAFVPSEESIEGKFEIFLDGKEPVELDWEDAVGGYVANAPFILKKAGAHKLLVKFKGKVDGEKVNLKVKKTVKFPSKDFRFEVKEDGKGTFGGKLLGVKKAEGRWTIIVFDPKAEEGVVAKHQSDMTTSLEYSHSFKGLKPGTYDVRISYTGKMNGVKAEADAILDRVKIGGDGSGDGKDPGKENPPVKKDPRKKIEVVDNPKGGQLPKTGTPYPSYALLGSLMLLAGLVLLKFRTARKF